MEYKKIGVYYQYGDGWKTSNNDMSIDWALVDIVGLVAERTYLPPTTLPTTLEGWISSVAAQLGDNFKSRYHVDPDYAQKPVKAKDKLAVTGKKCGDILRWACMVTGTFPRADAETGYLTAEPLWNQGNKTLLTALADYPTMKANKSVASLIFTLADGTQYVVSGNSTSSEKTINIENPIHPHLCPGPDRGAADPQLLRRKPDRDHGAGAIHPERSGTWTPSGWMSPAPPPPGG